MAITRSIIRIYSDETLQNLVKTVTTNSDAEAIDVTNLDEGQEYWATVQITDDGLNSEESEGYKFYTIPDCIFNDTPVVLGTSIYFDVSTVTNTVGIQKCGVILGQQGERRDRYYWDENPDYRGEIFGLLPNTSYILTPCVVDEFDRLWKNTSETTIIRTTSEAPQVAINNLNASATTVTGTVTVASEVEISDLLVRFLPLGGGTYINATGYTAQTGSQQFTATGLTPNTTYTIYATARNIGGNTTTTTTVTTLAITATVTLDDCDLSSQSPTDTVYVEATGTVGSGAEIDTVGIRFFTTNSTTGTPVGDEYGQQGQASVVGTVSGLPSGTTLYVFAYMDYLIGSELHTIYSASQTVVTVPVIQFTSQTVQETTCSGTFTVSGNTLSAVAVQYKAPNDLVWHDATVSGGTYTITNLTRGVTYSLKGTATNSGGTYTTPTTTFTPMAAGSVTFSNNSAWSVNENGYDIDYDYSSTYNIVSATVMVDTSSSFSNPTLFNGVVSGTDTGSIVCHTTSYNYQAGTTYYFRVIAVDQYSQQYTDDTYSACPTVTPTMTNQSSAFSTSVRRYQLRYAVSNTYALSNMEIKWASNAAMTTNVGTYNYALSGTSTSVSYNITNNIPSSGQTMYIKLTTTDVFGNTNVATYSAQVPYQNMTVTSSASQNYNEFTFTPSVSPSPTIAIDKNWIEFRETGSGSGYVRGNEVSGLNPNTISFSPNNYDVIHQVIDIYQHQQGTTTSQIVIMEPLLKEAIVDADKVTCVCAFNPNITYIDAAISYSDGGGNTVSERIDAKDGEYPIGPLPADTYMFWIDVVDDNGDPYKSDYVRVEIE